MLNMANDDELREQIAGVWRYAPPEHRAAARRALELVDRGDAVGALRTLEALHGEHFVECRHKP